MAGAAGFWRVCPPQSQHNARNVGSDRTLSERCLTNVDSDPRSLPAPGDRARPTPDLPPPRSPTSEHAGERVGQQPPSHDNRPHRALCPCSPPQGTGSRGPAGRGQLDGASSSVSNRPALPVPVPGWDRSVGRGGTHRRRVRDTTAQQPAAQTTGGAVARRLIAFLSGVRLK